MCQLDKDATVAGKQEVDVRNDSQLQQTSTLPAFKSLSIRLVSAERTLAFSSSMSVADLLGGGSFSSMPPMAPSGMAEPLSWSGTKKGGTNNDK